MRAILQQQVRRLGMEGRVSLPGETREIASDYRNADLFALSSRFEGFPNALCEAMANGLPVVSFDCPSGPREIVRHGVDGLLVANGNVAAFANALDRLMSDEQERRRLSLKAMDVASRFGVDRILDQWSNLFADSLERAPKSVQEEE